MDGAAVRWLRPGFRVDLRGSWFAVGHGGPDPTIRRRDGRVSLALRTPDGPAMLDLREVG